MRSINIEEVKAFIEAQGPNTRIYIGGDSERFSSDGAWYADYTLAIVVHINDILSRQVVKFKEYPYHSFAVSFQTNLPLPAQVGLGKGCSVGYGVVSPLVTAKSASRAGSR